MEAEAEDRGGESSNKGLNGRGATGALRARLE